ncbi:MAG: hypothetical protein IT158_03430 [Bryobacterales bacterium]|nr:hypothetical protein [Bryobacterales bacterium]
MPAAAAARDLRRAIGRDPDRLTLQESVAWAGNYIAMEIYSPETAPLRRIAAIGASVQECMRQLSEQGLDPARYEFSLLRLPY